MLLPPADSKHLNYCRRHFLFAKVLNRRQVHVLNLPFDYYTLEVARKIGGLFGSFMDYDSRSLTQLGGLRIKVSLPGQIRLSEVFDLHLSSGKRTSLSFLVEHANQICFRCGGVGFHNDQCCMAVRDDRVLFRYVGPNSGHVSF